MEGGVTVWKRKISINGAKFWYDEIDLTIKSCWIFGMTRRRTLIINQRKAFCGPWSFFTEVHHSWSTPFHSWFDNSGLVG